MLDVNLGELQQAKLIVRKNELDNIDRVVNEFGIRQGLNEEKVERLSRIVIENK